MPANNSPITVAEAHIQAVSVEIKALTIGKKQMTLSVFRQLPCKHIIGPELGLLGQPWGLVNYFWDGCGYPRKGGHLHVVWALHGRLFRACVGEAYWEPPFWNRSRNQVHGDPEALKWIVAARELSAGSCWAESEMLPDELDMHFDWWNKLYDQLAALDQLFIAV